MLHTTLFSSAFLCLLYRTNAQRGDDLLPVINIDAEGRTPQCDLVIQQTDASGNTAAFVTVEVRCEITDRNIGIVV